MSIPTPPLGAVAEHLQELEESWVRLVREAEDEARKASTPKNKQQSKTK
jgi:hypothetical protein